MKFRSALFPAVLFFLFPCAALPQVTSATAAKPDYSKEAYVIEQMSTKVAFDSEGKRTRVQETRVRVNTDAGVQGWGLLALPYESRAESVEIGYVRVRKPNDTVIPTPDDNVQDLDAEITRSAPFYSDLREKHIAVKGLSKGDVLEYQVFWNPTKPIIPGQFWFAYNFHHQGIVLNERLEIKVPASRSVKFKGPQGAQTVTTDGGFKTYAWTYANLQSVKDPESEQKKVDAARGRLPAPEVQFSSFQSWQEVGQWYWTLQKDRVEPSPAVRAKAAELTKGMTDDAQKLQALYSFVSMQFRYIGIAFGIGRYQPHSSDDVLGNNYGDCKDKHTLLAALLQASGITLYPALISSSHQLDPDIPSPGQFDHIIGYLPQGKTALWLDTTPEVAPPGYLSLPLRDKPALVISGEMSARLITTVADPPFVNKQDFKIQGTLKEDGSFEAHVDDTSRGDTEISLRSAFRRVPQPQWKDLVQQISYGLGYAGTVSDVSASMPETLGEPFHFSYSYNRKDYPDWTNHQFTVPGHPFYMPPVRDDANEPVWLGPGVETVSEARVQLPKGYKPEAPSDVDLKYDFAEYHASYTQDQGTLSAKRRLVIKMHEVPLAELNDYRHFLKAMQNDVWRYVQTSSSEPSSGASKAIPSAPATPQTVYASLLRKVRSLPQSNSAEANRFEEDARTSISHSDIAAAIESLKKAVESDPKFTRAWIELATAHLASGQSDSALEELRKAIDADPKAVYPRKMYGTVLMSMGRAEAALQAWQQSLQVDPEDVEANSFAGTLLLAQKRYSEAIPYLETAAQKDSSKPAQFRLGSAYLRAGQVEKGTAIFDKILETETSPEMLNDVAYEMADSNTNLNKAFELAQRAVITQEQRSRDIQISNLLLDDLASTVKIGMFWDTLGWADFRLGRLDEAERYLNSAWLLTQMSIVADHLGQVYETEKKTDKAIHMYRLAAATPEGRTAAGGEPQKHLAHLAVKPPTTVLEMMRNPQHTGDELSNLRTLKIKHSFSAMGTAEFFLLFAPGPKVEGVQFISGSQEMKSAIPELEQAKFPEAFPPGSSARLVRRGILMCSPVSGCTFVIYAPGSVHSLD